MEYEESSSSQSGSDDDDEEMQIAARRQAQRAAVQVQKSGRDQSRNSKTFLSAANIISGKKQSGTAIPDQLRHKLDQHEIKKMSLGTQDLAQLSTPIAHIAAKKLDSRVVKILIQRSRGFLMRKSQRVERKWTYCFYYIEQIPPEGTYFPLLCSVRPLDKTIDRSCFDQQDGEFLMRSVTLGKGECLLLFLYLQNKSKKQADSKIYMAFRCGGEDSQHFSSVIEQYQEEQVSQAGYKAVLNGGMIFNSLEIEKLELQSEDQRGKMVDAKKPKKVLLILD